MSMEFALEHRKENLSNKQNIQELKKDINSLRDDYATLCEEYNELQSDQDTISTDTKRCLRKIKAFEKSQKLSNERMLNNLSRGNDRITAIVR
jgi:chromosome segregation ATPase